MTDGNTYAINRHLTEREEWDELQEVTAALEQAQDRIEELEAKLAEAGVDVAASLNAAISLLERGGKKAAPSDKMFNQMLLDYKASLARFRTTLTELEGET